MKYLEPQIEVILLTESDVLTYSQEKEDIWDDFNP